MRMHAAPSRSLFPLARRARHMALIAALALTVSAGSALGGRTTDPVDCTHGASSLGPVSLVDGTPDAATPAPTTEECLP